MIRGLGYRPDPAKRYGEQPDWAFQAGPAVQVPDAVDMSSAVVEVLDQGRLGSCVANAGHQAIRMCQAREGRQAPLGSRLFSYYASRALDGTVELDAGTHPRSFFRSVNKVGYPNEALWPYDDDVSAKGRFRTMPPGSVLRRAHPRRVAYFKVTGATGVARNAAIRRALADGYPVVFGLFVDQRFVDGLFDPGAPVEPFMRAAIVGGHAMTLVGYDRDGFRAVNSWGTGWGDGGYCWIGDEAMAQAVDVIAVQLVSGG